MKRTELGWAIFLSIPVGVGVWVAVMRTSAGQDEVTAAGAGIAAGLAVFLIVIGGVIDWSGAADFERRE